MSLKLEVGKKYLLRNNSHAILEKRLPMAKYVFIGRLEETAQPTQYLVWMEDGSHLHRGVKHPFDIISIAGSFQEELDIEIKRQRAQDFYKQMDNAPLNTYPDNSYKLGMGPFNPWNPLEDCETPTPKPEDGPKECKCPITVLLQQGCQCGGK